MKEYIRKTLNVLLLVQFIKNQKMAKTEKEIEKEIEIYESIESCKFKNNGICNIIFKYGIDYLDYQEITELKDKYFNNYTCLIITFRDRPHLLFCPKNQ